MKLINYNYGDISKFNCYIRGKIIVSQKEWKAIKKYLLNPFTKVGAWLGDEKYAKKILKEDMQRIVDTKQGKLINIRVTATEKVVEKFNLKRYKRNNYMFLITNK